MNCSKFGCDEQVTKDARGLHFECPTHGRVNGLLHTNRVDLRAAQAYFELAELAGSYKTQH